MAFPDAYARIWHDYEDDLDAESMTDLEARMQARDEASAGGGGGLTNVADFITDYGADPTGAVSVTTAAGVGPLQDAIADINSNTIDALWIPPGIYALNVTTDTITASDWSIFGAGPASKLKSDSGHGVGTFFNIGDSGGTGASRWTIHDLSLQCNATGSFAPGPLSQAFKLVKGGTGDVYGITAIDISGLCAVGTITSGDHFQSYGFHRIRGNFNTTTSNPSRIHIINGTDGKFTNIRLQDNELNGGYGIHAEPTSGTLVDQHFFTNCEIWGEGAKSQSTGHGTTYDGITWNVVLDFTGGSIYNWNFTNCIFDEGTSGGAWIKADSGTETCKDVHFLDCHIATNGGRGIYVDQQGTGTVQLQVTGGRIRIQQTEPAIQLIGGDIDSCSISNVRMLQRDTNWTTSNATRDSILHDFKHGLSVDDEIIFAGTVPTTSPAGDIVAGTGVYVKNADANGDGKEFTLSKTTPAGSGATINITNAAAGGTYRAVCPAYVQFTDSLGVSVTGCYFGAFEGPAATEVVNAVRAVSSPDNYAIVGNVARGLSGAFSNVSTSGTSKIVENNSS